MTKATMKKTLAWLGIIIILGLFLYMSLQSYQLLTNHDKTAEQAAEVVSQNTDATTKSRVNWTEVVVLLVVGAGLVYAIRKTDDGKDA